MDKEKLKKIKKLNKDKIKKIKKQKDVLK